MLDLRFDHARGVMRLTSKGFWGQDEALRHYDALLAHVGEARSRGGMLRILVDGREGQVLSADSIDVFQRFERHALRSAGDRIAIIVSSALLKRQVRRILPSEQAQFFLAEFEALAWLKESVA